MNPTDRASLVIVGVSLVLIILVGFFFEEKGIFGTQNSPSYLIVTISIENNASGEANVVVYEDDGENKINPTFSSLSSVSIINNYLGRGYEVVNVFEEKNFGEKIEKTTRTVWFKK
tara:strand:- start:1474 stop:1821 length:348 start_codon:yes stop_codon:yes gene_type:complete